MNPTKLPDIAMIDLPHPSQHCNNIFFAGPGAGMSYLTAGKILANEIFIDPMGDTDTLNKIKVRMRDAINANSQVVIADEGRSFRSFFGIDQYVGNYANRSTENSSSKTKNQISTLFAGMLQRTYS